MKTTKNFLLSAVLLFTAGVTFGQTNHINVTGTTTGVSGDIYHMGGNVGIGTDSPLNNLHIKKDIANGIGPVLLLQNTQYTNSNGAGSAIKFLGGSSEGILDRYIQIEAIMRTYSNPDNLTVVFNNNGDIIKPLTIKYNGNVGIGTDSPLNNIHIKKDVANGIGPVLLLQNTQYTNSNGAGSAIKFLGGSSEGILDRYIQIEAIMRTYSNPDNLTVVFNNNGDIIKPLTIKYNGNVGIGTTTPTSMLTVAGKIEAREVQVTANAGADFVFEEDYVLKNLEEVETFIKENKHLPEMPSAKEMQEQGVNMGEFQIQLLQKIEELTLYVIELKKENEVMKKEIENLKD